VRTERLEAFSDGVFAVAITLLVLDLRLPPSNVPLLNGLADEWPDFGAFALSFVIIGIIWVNHHALFSRLRAVDRPLLFINIGLLMSVVVIPFTTSLFARYLVNGGSDAHLAAAIFSGSSLLMSLGFNAVYMWIDAHPSLRLDATPRPPSLRNTLRFGVGGVGYAAGVGLAFYSAPLVFVLSIAVALYYVLDQVTSSEPVED
jgi:uncharacterized membrane protein